MVSCISYYRNNTETIFGRVDLLILLTQKPHTDGASLREGVYMTVAVLNVKIDEAVKERLRHFAEVHGLTLGAAAEKLLLLGFVAEEEAGVCEDDIDSQHTEEDVAPFTLKEIKALRKILKKRK